MRARRRMVSGVVVVAVLALLLAGVVAAARPDRRGSVFVGPGRPFLTAVPSEVAFVDRTHGFGLLTQCEVPANADPVCDIVIGSSRDGGRIWSEAGRLSRVRYAGWRGYPFIDLAVSGNRVWVSGNRTFVSSDGGRTFAEAHPGGIVSSFTIRARDAWAAVRDCAPAQTCATKIASVPIGGGSWHVLTRAPAMTYPYVQLLRPTATVAYLLPLDGRAVAYRTDDAGRSWRVVRLPQPHDGQLAAFGSSRLWFLAQAANTRDATMHLARSDDGGQSWRADVTAPIAAPASGYIQAPVATARERLWLPIGRGPLLGSLDGGTRWFDAHVGSPLDRMSFVDVRHGWATSLGTALYRTTDGAHWHLVSGTPARITPSPAPSTTTSSTAAPTNALALVTGPDGFLVPRGWTGGPAVNSGGPASYATYKDPAGPGTTVMGVMVVEPYPNGWKTATVALPADRAADAAAIVDSVR
jgi:photosystem II stability/assembly factor-like uncharacterized protein